MQLNKYLKLDQKGKIMAEYVWVDAIGETRSKSRVSAIPFTAKKKARFSTRPLPHYFLSLSSSVWPLRRFRHQWRYWWRRKGAGWPREGLVLDGAVTKRHQLLGITGPNCVGTPFAEWLFAADVAGSGSANGIPKRPTAGFSRPIAACGSRTLRLESRPAATHSDSPESE